MSSAIAGLQQARAWQLAARPIIPLSDPGGTDSVFLGSARCAERAANAQNVGDDMKYGTSDCLTLWRYHRTRISDAYLYFNKWDCSRGIRYSQLNFTVMVPNNIPNPNPNVYLGIHLSLADRYPCCQNSGCRINSVFLGISRMSLVYFKSK